MPDARFRQLYSSQRHEYDRGDLNADQYWSEIARAAGVELVDGQVERLRDDRRRHVEPLEPGMLRWVEQLRAAGIKTAVLSNMHDDMVQKIRNDTTWAKTLTA